MHLSILFPLKSMSHPSGIHPPLHNWFIWSMLYPLSRSPSSFLPSIHPSSIRHPCFYIFSFLSRDLSHVAACGYFCRANSVCFRGISDRYRPFDCFNICLQFSEKVCDSLNICVTVSLCFPQSPGGRLELGGWPYWSVMGAASALWCTTTLISKINGILNGTIQLFKRCLATCV